MKFSVLMSVYRKEEPEYFRLAMESILQQTLLPDEIVLIKDGPLTPELEEAVEGFAVRYPNLLIVYGLEKNMGLGIALREGVKICRYPLIARMDTDDLCLPERFEKQVYRFKADETLDLLGTYAMEFSDNPENATVYRNLPVDHESIMVYAKSRNPFNHMTVMYRREAVLSAGNYQASRLNEDYYLWARMLMNGAKCENIPEHLVLVRAGENMYKRRGGLKYAATDCRLQCKFLGMGFLTKRKFIANCLLRTSIRLLPNRCIGGFYRVFLRKSEKY